MSGIVHPNEHTVTSTARTIPVFHGYAWRNDDTIALRSTGIVTGFIWRISCRLKIASTDGIANERAVLPTIGLRAAVINTYPDIAIVWIIAQV